MRKILPNVCRRAWCTLGGGSGGVGCGRLLQAAGLWSLVSGRRRDSLLSGLTARRGETARLATRLIPYEQICS